MIVSIRLSKYLTVTTGGPGPVRKHHFRMGTETKLRSTRKAVKVSFVRLYRMMSCDVGHAKEPLVLLGALDEHPEVIVNLQSASRVTEYELFTGSQNKDLTQSGKDGNRGDDALSVSRRGLLLFLVHMFPVIFADSIA